MPIELAMKSERNIRFCNIMHWSVIIIQFSLFGILLIMLILGTTNHFLSRTVFAISSTLATIIMIAISFKFFSWYKASKYKTLIVLFYAIGTLTLAYFNSRGCRN